MAGVARAAVERQRLVGIEGLRAVAAGTILIYHVWLYSAPGGHSAPLGPLNRVFPHLTAGVTLFFVLSGFLLYRPYVAAALRGTATPRARQYFLNRALRILPAYWTILFVTVVLFERDILSRPLGLLSNVFLAQWSVPGYVPRDLRSGNGVIAIVPSWSLAIEVVFYLLVPLLGALAIRSARGSEHNLAAGLAPVALMSILGVASKVAAYGFAGHWRTVWEAGFLPHADWFAAGMLVAVLRVQAEDGRLRLPRRWRPTAVALAIALLIGAIKLRNDGLLTDLEYQTPIAFACAILLALVVLAPRRSRLVRVLDQRPLVSAGLISYSVFLWHDPILRALRDVGATRGGAGGFLLDLMLIGVLTGAASLATYRLVERPALALKRAWHVSEKPSDAPVDAMGTIEAGELELAGARAQLGRLVEHVAGARAREVTVTAAAAPPLPAEVLTAVRQILDNALAYGSPPFVVSAQTANGIRVVVEDHGRGISDEFRPHLFQPGLRSEVSARERKGQGLGLFHARKLVRELDGEISFEPVAPTGARFTISFPTGNGASDSQRPRRANVPARSIGRRATVLISRRAAVPVGTG